MSKRTRALLVFLAGAAVAAVSGTEASADSSDMSDDQAVARCLKAWEKTPFTAAANETPKYRTIAPGVRILGIGGNVEDTNVTTTPDLVLVKPSVSVMSKTTIRLLNPNGWYCLKANVTVMAKTEVQAACEAKLADSYEGVAVFGSSQSGSGRGVTVMGKTVVERVGCPAPAPAPSGSGAPAPPAAPAPAPTPAPTAAPYIPLRPH